MSIQWLGSPEKCFYCDEKSNSRTGIVYQCDWHKLIWDIVMKAQSGAYLIVKNGEYWDYKSDTLAKYIEEKLAPLKTHASKLPQNSED